MDIIEFDINKEDDLSITLGTKSLAARDIIFKGFNNTLRAHALIK
jgi:hypothetical protein